jgi:hypothetical protein
MEMPPFEVSFKAVGFMKTPGTTSGSDGMGHESHFHIGTTIPVRKVESTGSSIVIYVDENLLKQALAGVSTMLKTFAEQMSYSFVKVRVIPFSHGTSIEQASASAVSPEQVLAKISGSSGLSLFSSLPESTSGSTPTKQVIKVQK